ncbi:hypothetical protein NKG94_34365 [Micromonospora sp. M12]
MTTTHLIRGYVPRTRRCATSPVAPSRTRRAACPSWLTESASYAPPAPTRSSSRAPAHALTGIALALTGAVLAELVAALHAILSDNPTVAWTAAGAMVLLGIAIFPVLTHAEMEMGT